MISDNMLAKCYFSTAVSVIKELLVNIASTESMPARIILVNMVQNAFLIQEEASGNI